MLTWLRDNAKIFLIATIVIFVGLIFLNWGMGEGGPIHRDPYRRPVAVVDGSEIMPDEYQRALQSWSQNYRRILENSNNPDPEAMMILMSDRIAEEAFQEMIDRKLQNIYLSGRNWDEFTLSQAEEMIRIQVSMQDLGDMTPDEYINRIRSEQPGLYQQYLYQSYVTGNTMRFPVSAFMICMASRDEVEHLLVRNQAQLTANYIVIDTLPPMPDSDYFASFYEERTGNFARPDGSLLRYVTIQVTPEPRDFELAIHRVDSLTFATPGAPARLTREQLETYFGDTLALRPGERTAPFPGAYSGGPSMNAYHVLLLDSVQTAEDTLSGDHGPGDDILYLRSWEVPVVPRYDTVRRTMWDMKTEIDEMLSGPVPRVPDTLLVLDFGDMIVEEGMRTDGHITEEMISFAADTLWADSVGPVFYSPSYRGGYPALTVVRRLQHLPADTLTLEEALDSGMLQQEAYRELRTELAWKKAVEVMDDIRRSGVSLQAYAEMESLELLSTPAFTAVQIMSGAAADPRISGGILSSPDFALAAMTAPELEVTGPFVTAGGCVLAEVTSRQLPPEDRGVRTVTYLSVQNERERLSRRNIMHDLREMLEVRDLREEWTQHLEAVQDSIRDSS